MKRYSAGVFSLMFVLSVSVVFTVYPTTAFAHNPAFPDCIGPIVWDGYCQNQLDFVYNQSNYNLDPPDTGTRDSHANTELIERFGEPEQFSYGPSQYEKLLLYRAKTNGKAPILVYIHGGAWRGGAAAGSMYPAEMFIEAGAHFIALDFVNTLQNGGNLLEMADQVRRGVAWVYKNAKLFNGDEKQIYVSGHSSGGHLCGVVMTTNWEEYGLLPNTVKGGLCTSGMYDLWPVSLSYRNTWVNFTDETIDLLSPINQWQYLNAPIVLIVGTKETPEFIRQTEDFAAFLGTKGKNVKKLTAWGYNHFEDPETLANPYGYFGRAALELMGLQPNMGKKK
jgi:arylformamidase